ncbi:MAG: type I methionyl aminopeptidase [Catalinimonas sp.]
MGGKRRKGGVRYKTAEEIEIIRRNGDLLGRCHAEVAREVEPGVRTEKLNRTAEAFIADHGGKASFKGFNGFPAALCISVNDRVVHGFPGKYELRDGDIVSIDCGIYKNGLHADSAYTYPVGIIKSEVQELLDATKASLQMGIEAIRRGNRLGDVGFAIQRYVETRGYGVVRELVGHGVGRELHEAPEVPNYGRKGKGLPLQDGLVIAVEPMVNLGKRGVVQESDGWTIRTADRRPSAHFEHTVAVRNGTYDVLTTFQYIEEVVTT